MFVQLPKPLPCACVKGEHTHCSRPGTVGVLDLADMGLQVSYIIRPICPSCIQALASLSRPVAAPVEETIGAAQIRAVLAGRLGFDGADEVLAEIRAAAGGDDEEGLDDA